MLWCVALNQLHRLVSTPVEKLSLNDVRQSLLLAKVIKRKKTGDLTGGMS